MRYDYKCDGCKTTTTANRSVENRNNCPKCACGGETRKIITGGVGFQDYFLGSTKNPGYVHPCNDEYVTSKRQQDRIAKEHNIEPAPSAGGKFHSGFR